jgi:hypothetical protein
MSGPTPLPGLDVGNLFAVNGEPFFGFDTFVTNGMNTHVLAIGTILVLMRLTGRTEFDRHINLSCD